VEVTVRDTGTGMSPEVLAQAMDPFFTTKPPGQGTGLGLSSAQAVARAHGGSLVLRSAPGQGTTAILRLPGIRAPEPAARTPEPASGIPAAGGPPGHVVLVDDDEDVRILTARLLSRSGVERVETFGSGEAFLAQLDAGPAPTLVVLDQNMPGLTGDQVLARIRAGHPRLPVLISSGQPDLENWSAFRQPFTRVISKPFTLGEIQAKLAELAQAGWDLPAPAAPQAAAGLEEAAPVLAGFARARLAEDALRASGERFARAFVDNPVAMVLTQLEDGVVLEVNHAWAGLMGCRREDVIGHPVRAMDIWPSSGDGAQFIGELRTNKALHGREQEFRTLDGRRVVTRVWSQVLSLHGQEVVLSTLIDVSENRRLREELDALSQDLDRRVEDRSAERVALSQEREAFSYAVSHDLRAPLRALSGYTQALVEDFGEAIPAGARDYLGRIHQASRRMGELIDGLLALARDSRGDLIRRPVDLSELAEAVRRDLVQGEPERSVDWRIEPGLRAMGDERLLKVVLANLLGNAWKYTQQRPQAAIAFDALDRDGTRWFQVSDNGAGFEMAYASKLFTPFQRLHRPDEFPGLGIGLATVKRIIQRHGGTIEAQAEPGLGASFRFTLPE
jgi:PAS domain S-box-containing protein